MDSPPNLTFLQTTCFTYPATAHYIAGQLSTTKISAVIWLDRCGHKAGQNIATQAAAIFVNPSISRNYNHTGTKTCKELLIS